MAGGISSNESIPTVKIWLRNLIEHLLGIPEITQRRNGKSRKQLAGRIRIKEEANAKQLSMNLFELG